MINAVYKISGVIIVAGFLCVAGCDDIKPFSRAYEITNRAQLIGGEAALAELGDYIVENDKIRLAIPQIGNSVGPGLLAVA